MSSPIESENPETPDSEIVRGFRQGQYLSDDGRWELELRIEVKSAEPGGASTTNAAQADGTAQSPSSGYRVTESELAWRIAAHAATTISADLRSNGSDGPQEFYVRSRAGTKVTARDDGSWVAAADWLGPQGHTGTGSITIRPGDAPVDVVVRFDLDVVLEPLPAGFTLEMTATFFSETLRNLGLEIRIEEGQQLPEGLAADGIELTDIMRAHGVGIRQPDNAYTIAAPDRGSWAASDIFTVLNEQLQRSGPDSLLGPAWDMNLLLLSKTDRDGLLGVMFDCDDRFPRQGAAVFVDEIKRQSIDAQSRRILVTAVHELGHTLNLTHRFLRDVGQANSRSFMNYDWVYNSQPKSKRDGAPRDYWKDFPYQFDRDELEFLLHGPRASVIPGGDPFGSARYWLTGDHGLPAANEISDLELWLTPPARGIEVGYGQPVFLEVSLRNTGVRTYCVPRHALDVKAGMLDLLIQRPSDASSSASTEPFTPMMQRCFAVAPEGRLTLTPQASMHDNVNLVFGAGGSPFTEPGDYLITPELILYEADDVTPVGVVHGDTLLITIQPPNGEAERQDAETIFQTDSGIVLSLGGTSSLHSAAVELDELSKRRMRDRSTEPDSMVAATLRMQGLDARRSGDKKVALDKLRESVSGLHAATFDPHTLAHTKKLVERLAAEQPGGADQSAPAVNSAGTVTYVDLVSKSGDKSTSFRRPGRLVTRTPESQQLDAKSAVEPPKTGLGVAVLFNLPLNLPRGSSAGDIKLSAVVNTADGVSQRLGVTHLDVFGNDSETSEPFAIATLDQAVPTEPPTRFRVGEFDTRNADRDAVEQVLTRNEIPLPEAVGATDVVAVADPVPDQQSAPDINIFNYGDLLSRWCDWTRLCSDVPPVKESPYPVPACGCIPSTTVTDPVPASDAPQLVRRSTTDGD